MFNQELAGSSLQLHVEWELVLQDQEQQELIKLDSVAVALYFEILCEDDVLQYPLVNLKLRAALF